MKNFRFTGIAVLAMLLFATVLAYADIVEKVKNDFAPVSGWVVMASATDEYIVDLDASNGIAVGDLLAVVEQGKQIVHPVTHKILGSLDKTIAVLQIEQVKSGYSYARTVRADAGVEINAGTKLERFSNLSAVFRDADDAHEAMYVGIRAALPQLEWQDSMSATHADLFFSVTANGLEVRDSKGTLIRTYALERPAFAPSGSTPTNAIAAPAASQVHFNTDTKTYPALTGIATPAAGVAAIDGGSAVRYETVASGAAASAGSSMFNMEFPRFNKIGQLGKKTVMADFEKVGGQLLLALTDGSSVQVYNVAAGFKQVAAGDSATMGNILALSWYQPSPGDVYLCVTVWADKRINTDLLRLQGNKLQPVISGNTDLVAAFDTDGDMQSELLLSQEFDREYFYGSRVRQLQVRNARFEDSPLPFEFPDSFQIFGAIITDVTGDGAENVAFVRNRRLYIFNGTEQIYKSSSEIGGSVSSITYDVDPDAQNPMINSASIEVAPVAADIDGDGRREIVAIAADGNIMRSVGIASAIDKSWLAVFKFERGMVIKGTLGDQLERPLQGVAVADGHAFMLATDVGSLMGSGEGSYLLSIPLR